MSKQYANTAVFFQVINRKMHLKKCCNPTIICDIVYISIDLLDINMSDIKKIKYDFCDYDGDNSAEDILNWALGKFHPRIAVATSLQDAVVIHLASRIRKDIRIFTIDTGRLPEESYKCAAEITRKLGVNIEWFFPRYEDVQRLITEKGVFSFKESLENRRECCTIRKVEPLKRALSGLEAWITGLRSSENITRTSISKIEKDIAHGGILKINPLADWSDERVRAYIEEHNIPYNELIDHAFPSIGCTCCTRAVQSGESLRAGRWWWEQAEHKECGLHVRDWNI